MLILAVTTVWVNLCNFISKRIYCNVYE